MYIHVSIFILISVYMYIYIHRDAHLCVYVQYVCISYETNSETINQN